MKASKDNLCILLTIVGFAFLVYMLNNKCVSNDEHYQRPLYQTLQTVQPQEQLFYYSRGFIPSIQSSNPQIKGVTIVNDKDILLKSMINAGNLTPELAVQIKPKDVCKGETAFNADAAVVRDSLELSPTLEQERLHLAAAQTGFVPDQGIAPNMLWYRRTTVDQLNQPGLSPDLAVASNYTCF